MVRPEEQLFGMHRSCLFVLAARTGRCQNRASEHPRDEAYCTVKDSMQAVKSDGGGSESVLQQRMSEPKEAIA